MTVSDRESKNKVTKGRAKTQQCVLVIFSCHRRHNKRWGQMSPLQIHVAATSALLLTCVYLFVGANIPTRRDATGVTVLPATLLTITKRTGSEAINAKFYVDNYLREAYTSDSVSASCSTLVPHIVLPCPQDVSGCNSSVNVSTNLNYLRHMYTHVLGLIYQNSTDESQLEQLDLLEMVFYRLSNQMQRYLQAHNLSSVDAKWYLQPNTRCTCHAQTKDYSLSSGYDKCTVLPQELNNTEIAHVILCHLREMAKSTLRAVGEENSRRRPYQFCISATHLNC